MSKNEAVAGGTQNDIREAIFEEEIRPRLAQIMALCKAHDIQIIGQVDTGAYTRLVANIQPALKPLPSMAAAYSLLVHGAPGEARFKLPEDMIEAGETLQ